MNNYKNKSTYMLIDALSKLGLPFKVNPFKDNSDDYGRSEY